MFQIIEDPLANLLHSSRKMDFLIVMDYDCQFQLNLELPIVKKLFLFEKNERKVHSSSHLLSWLHLFFDFT